MRKLLLLVSLFALFSCKETVLYSETGEDFKDNRWVASDIKKFDFELKRDVDAGDITVVLSHVHNPQFPVIPLKAVIEYPSGEKEDVALNLAFKDAGGNDISECLGDVCDLHFPIKEDVKLAKGKYRVTLQNNFPNAYLPNVIAVGLSVDSDN